MNSATEVNTDWMGHTQPPESESPMLERCLDYLRASLPQLLVLSCILGIVATVA